MADVGTQGTEKLKRGNGWTERRESKRNGTAKRSRKTAPRPSDRKRNGITSISSDGESSDTSNDTDAENRHPARCDVRISEERKLVGDRVKGAVQHTSGQAEKQSSAEHVETASLKETSLSPEEKDLWMRLTNQPSLLKNKYPEDYSQLVGLKEPSDGHQLSEISSHPKLHAVLEKYVSGKPFSAWTSKRLAAALNIPVSIPAMDSLQLLLLAENKPPLVCVLCDTEDGSKETALVYACDMARELTRALLAYCHCEFIILAVACVASADTLTAEQLGEEVEKRRKETSKIYYRRQHLIKREYQQLKMAVTRVSRVAPVHQHHADINNTTLSTADHNKLVELDEDWYNLVLFLISRAEKGRIFNLPLPGKVKAVLKVKVAVREASRRLGMKMDFTDTQDGCLQVRVGE